MEGWDGLFIWPEDIPRAEPKRERGRGHPGEFRRARRCEGILVGCPAGSDRNDP